MRKVSSRVFKALFSRSKGQDTHKSWSKASESWTLGLLGLLMLVGQANAYEIYSAKKGIGSSNATRIEAVHSSWYYNWNIQRVAGVDPAIEYVPMKHNQWWRSESELANIGEFNYFLGFNEPEAADQGNITVAQAINQWPNLEAAVAAYGTPGAQMGSPVTANPNVPWIIDFMTQAASGGLQVDFMAMHKYPTPVSSGSILSGAQWYHDTYNRDVWITEFNAADWTAPNDYTQEQTYTWMSEVLFRMESTSYITRYAIFPWDGSTSASAASPVFEPGGDVLTPLGKLYAEYHSNDIYGPYEQVWYHLHNKGSRMRLCDNAGTPSTADIYTEGAPVEFELAPAGGANYYIVNRGTGELLGSNGTTTYWTASETGSSVQWSLTTSIYNWMFITHAGSGNYLYGQNTGQVGLSSTAPNDNYKWTFVRSGAPYVVIGNNAPTFAVDPISKPNATENAAYSGTIAGSATDVDNDTLIYSSIFGPAWLDVAYDGTLSGTPTQADAGANSWTVQVSDGNGGTDTATLNITVDGLPGGTAMTTGYSVGSGLLSPTGEILFVDYAALGGSDTTASSGYSDAFTVLINGSGQWNIGETVEITGIALPIHASTLNGTMTFTVLQGAGGAGDTGAGGLAVLGTATASYNNSGSTGNMYVNFDTPVSFVADANSTSIGINISNTALLRLKYDGTFEITQYNRSTGNTVSYMKVSVAGNVIPVNNPPTFTTDPVNELSATEGAAYSSTLADDASDPESDPLTFSKVSGPTWLSVASDGALSGTPTQADVGANVFTVQVNATGGSDTATLNITVANVNDAPVFTVDPINEANATEGVAYSGSIANATDDENDPLTYSKVTGPAWLVVAANGSLSGTPGAGDVGANVFSVQVSDGNGGSDTATLNITVDAPANQPPVWNFPPTQYNATEGVFYQNYNEWRVSDPEGDSITWAKVSGPAWASVNILSGELSGTPGAGDVGTYSITISITDSYSTPVEVTADIVVAPAVVPSTHVSAIVPSVVSAGGPNRYGVATVTILDANDQPVSGATVSGTFTGSYSESGNAITGANGVAVIQTVAKTKNPSFTFTVTGVTASGYTYDSASNVETSDSY